MLLGFHIFFEKITPYIFTIKARNILRERGKRERQRQRETEKETEKETERRRDI